MAAASSTLAPLAPIRPTSISSITSTLNASAATSSPSISPNAGTYILLLPPCHAWSCWTPTEHHAIIASTVLLGVLLIAVLVYVVIMHRKRKRRVRGLERGPGFEEGNANEKGGLGVWWRGKVEGKGKRDGVVERGGNGKGRARSRSRQSQGRPRGIEGLESIELGPAAARSLLESGGGGGLGTARGAGDGIGDTAEGEGVRGGLLGGEDKGVGGREKRSEGRFEMD